MANQSFVELITNMKGLGFEFNLVIHSRPKPYLVYAWFTSPSPKYKRTEVFLQSLDELDDELNKLSVKAMMAHFSG